MRVKAWRKRRCEINEGSLFIYHSDETQPPTKLNLLTCQVKLVPGKEKKCFDLISFNRTYHFQVEDEHDITAWVYVLINCKEGALQKQFDSDPNCSNNNKDFVDFGNNTTTNSLKHASNDVQDLHRLGAEHHVQQQLIRQVQDLNANDRCVDCSTTKDRPTWLSTNLGVLVCIECSGIHRDLGVHISRIQSLTLDNINTSQLLIAHNMGNGFFNEIFESKLRQLELLAADIASPNFDTPKLKPNSSMEQRCEFIKSKYIQKKFCQNIHRDDVERAMCLREAVITKDLRKLVQLFGEGFDLASCISNLDDDEEDVDNNVDEDNADMDYYSKQQQDCHYSNRKLNKHQDHHNRHHNHSYSHLDHHHHFHSRSRGQQNNHLSSYNLSIKSNYHQNSMDDSIDTTIFQPSKPIINDQDTSIHLALSCQATRDNSSVQFECDLYILDFIIQNSRAINKQNCYGETPLHYCAKYNLPECMKMLIKAGADPRLKNDSDETPLDLVLNQKPAGYKLLIEILGGTEDDLDTSGSSGRLEDNSLNDSKQDDKSIVIRDDASENYSKLTNHSIHVQSNDRGSEGSSFTTTATTRSPIINDKDNHCSPRNVSSNGGSPIGFNDLPIPPPRRRTSREKASPSQPVKSQALYSCTPDNEDELGFEKGEIIAITSEQTADPEWWQGYIEGQPERRGIFPATFVKILHE